MPTNLPLLSNDYFDPASLKQRLRSDDIRAVPVYALGPAGTNLQQASQKWIKAMEIEKKSEITLCPTPEISVERAQEVSEPGIVPIFALCAVYFSLCRLYFKHGSNYTFLSHLYAPLDEMQLASHHNSLNELAPNAKIATHVSPASLLDDTAYERVIVNSNSEAARRCAAGDVDACITTESARKIYGLKRNFLFGSPSMLFTFGTTRHGVEELKRGMDPSSLTANPGGSWGVFVP